MSLNSGEFQTKRLGVVGNRSHLLWFVVDGKVHNLFTSSISQLEKVTGREIDIKF